jgi:aspartate carbamoyltransferase catalytic subunit
MVQHIVKTQNFTKDFLAEIFSSAREIRKVIASGASLDILHGKVIATLFYEESTRTRLSFETAAYKLGAGVVSSTNARQFSSVSKGESLEDTIKTLHGYADCIILRYYKEGGAARAAHFSKVPIINGGDGSGQHPTQSLLDLFTIEDELGQIDGLKVMLVGDLKHGRTVHSLAYLLGKFDNIQLRLIAPKNLQMPEEILSYLERHGVGVIIDSDFRELIGDIDVLYQTRIQKERFNNLEEYEESKSDLAITRQVANSMKSDAIILHPLPRVDEIRYGVDDNHRAKYFTQAENGIYVRMALLKYLLT